MTASAIVMMVIGIVLLWGGLAASITNAVRKSKDKTV
ncbi:methionine/alanine import family NSS transporter small subunit [Jeotgalibacillus haloalkalitolerans]|uniref:Methionine/alanine import family NSS transporter small subunit n=1 Tax=Jeotgalibacillus haloalkalitolerans TaxID=3104292 RepID=A0ABU5KQS7_9BACL|nr:methionine/alanine import family NSS transporter small subunit [Jeotgalibacillus sp. HH7-29]MDZ5713607.1 methionine/alanine import family NSS transporter small subunit [Jeotgalibacillus sp. HH7-29]